MVEDPQVYIPHHLIFTPEHSLATMIPAFNQLTSLTPSHGTKLKSEFVKISPCLLHLPEHRVQETPT